MLNADAHVGTGILLAGSAGSWGSRQKKQTQNGQSWLQFSVAAQNMYMSLLKNDGVVYDQGAETVVLKRTRLLTAADSGLTSVLVLPQCTVHHH